MHPTPALQEAAQKLLCTACCQRLMHVSSSCSTGSFPNGFLELPGCHPGPTGFLAWLLMSTMELVAAAQERFFGLQCMLC